MGDTISPLSASVLRNLADKLYEKRKIAALEVLLLFNKTPTLSLSPPLCLPLSNCFFSFSCASKNVGIREEVHANGDLWLELAPQLPLATSVERSLYDSQNVGHGNRILLHLPIWLLSQLQKGRSSVSVPLCISTSLHACMWFPSSHHTWVFCSLYSEQNQKRKNPKTKIICTMWFFLGLSCGFQILLWTIWLPLPPPRLCPSSPHNMSKSSHTTVGNCPFEAAKDFVWERRGFSIWTGMHLEG